MEALLGSALKIANHAGVVAQQINDMKAIDMSPDEQGIYAMAAHASRLSRPSRTGPGHAR